MPYVEIPDEALDQDKLLSAILAYTKRENDAYINNVRALIDQLLETGSNGHRHQTGVTNTHTVTFEDRFVVKTGSNDKIDFKHAGGSKALATYATTLDAGTYTASGLAAEIQAEMRSSIGGGNTDIVCTYDNTDGSESRGRFIIQHAGTSDSPNTRDFQLLFGSGANGPTGTDTSAANLIGFEFQDRLGAFGYVGTSGFLTGFTQDTITYGDGGLIGASGLQSNSITTAKFADGVVTTAKILDGAVQDSNIAADAIEGDKYGAPVDANSELTISGSGGTGGFQIVMPNGGSTRKPACIPICVDSTNRAQNGDLLITSGPTHFSGNTWNLTVTNNNANNLLVHVVAF